LSEVSKILSNQEAHHLWYEITHCGCNKSWV